MRSRTTRSRRPTIESALLFVSALCALVVLSIGQEYAGADDANAAQLESLGRLAMDAYDLAFQLAMIALGTGSLLLCYVLYRYRLVPRALAVLGFVGYLSLFASGWLEIAGASVPYALYIPGGLFEIAFPLWLIAKGFSEPAVAPRHPSPARA